MPLIFLLFFIAFLRIYNKEIFFLVLAGFEYYVNAAILRGFFCRWLLPLLRVIHSHVRGYSSSDFFMFLALDPLSLRYVIAL